MTIESDRRLALTKTTNNNIKTCICPDDKVTQKFDMTALHFDLEKGFSIKTKVNFSHKINKTLNKKYIL